MLDCCFKGKTEESDEALKIEGTVVLMKKNVLDFTDFNATILDDIHELVGKHVSFQLISSTVADPDNESKGKLGKPAYLEKWISSPTSAAIGESNFGITFNWDMEKDGVPGAVIVKNNHHSEFYLKSLTLENFPAKGKIHFDCKSWVYPVKYYSYDRVFFTNNTYVLHNTPEALLQYRKEELVHLRGDDHLSELQTHDRIYGYAFYNDLGNPDKGSSYARPVLGGSEEYPYPRRCRTSRPPTKTDPNTESRLPGINLDIYVPRDERFGHLKLSDFLGNAIKIIATALVPTLNALVDKTPLEFDTFQDVLNLYEGGIELPDCPELDKIKDQIPWELIKDLFPESGDRLFRLPMPQVIKEDKNAWRTDEEFAREMLAGDNPVIIRRLQEFPPTSKLDSKIYGDHTSSMSVSHIESNLEGLTVDQAISNNRLFILDHHDMLMPYLNRINSDTGNKIYATRTLLFLKDDDTLKPLAIELSLPNPKGEQYGSVDKVFTPAKNGIEGSVWHLAKSYAAVNDSGVHQLVSHWLNTHAVIEPFGIATNRQLSVMHPVYKLLSPHYRDTMNINALARQILINGNGLLELTVFPQKYSLEFSSVVYKNWKFTDAALPVDLIKRGVAVEDITQPMNLRLLIKDYPYAVDGLAIWSAIETWVKEYCSIYYASDLSVQTDDELQAWWKEIREVGHGDKKDEPWWPEMKSLSDLTSSCTTIIWIASALHAAVNFGQYPYAGYLPNRPTISRQFMPEPYTEEYEELEKNPEKVFLKTITKQLQTIIGVSLIEILSKHSSDEVYLGQRDTTEWTSDDEALQAFKRFGDKLLEIEGKIMEMNRDKNLKNRNGPVKVPYTLLYPNTSDFSKMQVTGKGIPNSTSI